MVGKLHVAERDLLNQTQSISRVAKSSERSYNNNIYLLQLGCHPVAVVISHVHNT